LQIKKNENLISKDIKGNITFKNVGFKYESREEFALKDVSFDIAAGERVNFVGSSGCGKSTILKLLLGFYHCREGEITIDGTPITDYDVHCLREHFGTVSQEPELFDDTVEYNIAYNLPNVSKEQIYAAARTAKLIQYPRENNHQ
jgi:ABC-type multidrug transport system fused ATPase/permease subunit